MPRVMQRPNLRPAAIVAAGVCVLLAAAGPVVTRAAESPRSLRSLEESGRWREAARGWGGLVEADPADRAAWAGYLAALETAGLQDELDAAAGRAMARFPGWDDPAVRRARALASLGRGEEAVQLLGPYVAASIVARVERGSILMDLGRREEADADFSVVVKGYVASGSHTPEELLAVGRAARGRGDYHGAARVMQLAFTDSLEFLPARIALADLFQEKHQASLAASEVNDARRLAPNHPDVILAAGRLALLNNRFPQAETVARQLLTVRPSDADARRILAHLDLLSGRTDLARENLRPTLDRNPGDRASRALWTAAAYFDGDSTAWRDGVRDLLAEDPLDSQVFLVLGDILELLIRNPEAIAMYRRVVEVDPANAVAWAALGHLAMREGREEEAREYLERGFELDNFNIRAYNQLELLDFMENFSDYPGENLRIRLKADEDSVLVPLLAERFHAIYEDLTERHGWRPEVPTVLEIFPSHDWFSARVTGMAWLEGIPGVCFGDVVAMDSPRTLAGHSNWEQILRHEFGHVLALGMTKRQVPFWFTEGLSVFLETHPRGQDWDEVLVGAYWSGEIVSVDSLTIAFTRPRHRLERLLAYHESGLIIGDIVERHGWKAIPGLLRAFGEGKTMRKAVPEVLGESYEEFSRRCLEVVTARARSLPVWPAPLPERIEAFRAAVERDPEDLRALGRLGALEVQLGVVDDAAATAARILDLDPGNPRGLGILGLSMRKDEERRSEARSHLEAAVEAGSADLPVHLALAAMTLADGDTALAVVRLERSLEVYPYATSAIRQLASLAIARGDTARARERLERLIEVDDSAAVPAVDLARLELDRGEGEAALTALDFALGVLPLEADVISLRGRALLQLDRDDEAFAQFSRARRLDIRSVESMVGMAEFYFKRDDYEEAAYFAELALKYDPDHAAARRVLEDSRNAW